MGQFGISRRKMSQMIIGHTIGTGYCEARKEAVREIQYIDFSGEETRAFTKYRLKPQVPGQSLDSGSSPAFGSGPVTVAAPTHNDGGSNDAAAIKIGIMYEDIFTIKGMANTSKD
ncbi:uncharacterized protein TrAFT101_006646 [Trichoderma asperellum]|uniref:uncharacterized protein n=1 Tax=Trichoderma asperellum TaxID=101201 RepID=UPI0033184143|nr:hypothetical protein TrAFT101_006646 [Trichoderma asperellum]